MAAAWTLSTGLMLAGSRPGGLAAAPACAADQHHATVVVSHLDPSRPATRVCVGFAEAKISGHDLLTRSGIEVGLSSQYGGQGTAVCQVDNEPSTYPPDCLNTSGPYWSVWTASYGGVWSYARSAGIDRVVIQDGDAEGFRYAGPSEQHAPAATTGVCPPPQPAPAPSIAANRAGSPPAGAPGAPTARPRTPSPASAPAPSPASLVSPASTGPPAASAMTDFPPGPAAMPAQLRPHASGGWLGPAAAAVAAVLLLGVFATQVILPRVRR